jgi:alkanesulfonate monooxygenase SsuD/methylene tetrahydromethanopterin reductase-like flavin-dependent oxidoreductase (luciferase family)
MMKLGLFLGPVIGPNQPPYETAQWLLQELRWADELGYSEAWIGEHFTIGWEPVPSPDLLIAQALRETKDIVLAPGVHLLPYHNPIELACRVAYLDHLAQGRYMLGIGAGAFETDAKLFDTKGRNHDMMEEALKIMLKVWSASQPFEFRGKYWNVGFPAQDELMAGPHIKPFQKPHPPIGMAGLSPHSSTLRLAGERGFIPLSLHLSAASLGGHWAAYEEGAAKAGRKAERCNWRVGREFFVADTDAEAFKLAVNGAMGRAYRNFMLPALRKFGLMRHILPDLSTPESDVTVEYLARRVWLVGSPQTVARKLRDHCIQTGGFGTLLGLAWDYRADPEPWRRSLELMAKEVLPQVPDLDIGSPSASAGAGHKSTSLAGSTAASV